jgi:Lon protease-like protein
MPLFPLADVVHFPHTDLRLHVAEAAARRLIRDVIAKHEDARWIGIVLIKPGAAGAAGGMAGRPEVFAGGTAGLLLDAEQLPDGCSNIILHGEFRFRMRREVTDQPYREALVEPVEEPWLDERDAGIVAVRGAILDLLRWLAAELRGNCVFGAGEIAELDRRCRFEELVNRVAADLDVPALRKQQLLQEALPERALSLLSILRNRQKVVEQLRPFRHLAGNHLLN